MLPKDRLQQRRRRAGKMHTYRINDQSYRRIARAARANGSYERIFYPHQWHAVSRGNSLTARGVRRATPDHDAVTGAWQANRQIMPGQRQNAP